MSSKDESKPLYASVNAKIMSDYLASIGVAARCTMCRSENLPVPEVRSATGSMSCGTPLGTYNNLFIMKSAYGDNASLRCYALLCEHCGHIMTFRAENILEWRRKVIMEKASEGK